MSDRDLRSEHTYPLLNNGVIVLSESIDMPVGKTLSYTLKEMEYMFDRSTFDRHDDTDDVYQPRWPWCFPTISPDVPSGEHICYTTQCDRSCSASPSPSYYGPTGQQPLVPSHHS